MKYIIVILSDRFFRIPASHSHSLNGTVWTFNLSQSGFSQGWRQDDAFCITMKLEVISLFTLRA